MTSSTQTLAESLGGPRADGRASRLADSVRRLRTRARAGDFERWMLFAGGLLMPLGILLIILGWLGAAHTPLPFEQTDYLISGGILGLALTFAGGFTYFSYWHSVRIRESREQSRDVVEALARVEALLTGGRVASTGAVSAMSFVATPNGSIFHRADCSVVSGRTDLTAVDPKRTKLDPCRICTPLDA
jgi:hypothetical protein